MSAGWFSPLFAKFYLYFLVSGAVLFFLPVCRKISIGYFIMGIGLPLAAKLPGDLGDAVGPIVFGVGMAFMAIGLIEIARRKPPKPPRKRKPAPRSATANNARVPAGAVPA